MHTQRAGELMAWPFLVLLMGCQMIMILYKRLKDTTTVMFQTKQTVVDDIVEALVRPSFVGDLLEATPVKPLQSLKSSFDRLARISKASLSDVSAQKLFELNIMVLKTMIMCCGSPQQMVEMLQRHLSELKTMTSLPELLSLISKLKTNVNETFSPLPLVELHALRRQLCLVMQGMKIKASILLTSQLQGTTGDIKVSLNGSDLLGGRQAIGLLHFPTGSSRSVEGPIAPSQPMPDERWPDVLGAYMWEKWDQKDQPRKLVMLEVQSDEQLLCRTLGGEELVLSTREVKKLTDLKDRVVKHFQVDKDNLVLLRGDGTLLRQFESKNLLELLKSDGEELQTNDTAIQAMLEKKVVWLKRDTTDLFEAPKETAPANETNEATNEAPNEAAAGAEPEQLNVMPVPPKKPASKGARVCALM